MLNEKQYETPANFIARVNLNGKFRANPESWNQWLFKHLPTTPNLKILELGCGTGLFWRINHSQIPASWQITLTDYSPGMLEAARQNLSKSPFLFRFETVNAEELPYEEKTFDIIIANLMLYHLRNRNQALQGISRILKPGGMFFASTFGRANMLELNHLLDTYSATLAKNQPHPENPFSLENGYEQLVPYFSQIQRLRYKNHLEITESDPIIDYFLSLNNIQKGIIRLAEEDIAGFRNILETEIQKNKVIKVTKDTGMFCCEK